MILVYAELNREGEIAPVSLELAAKAREIAGNEAVWAVLAQNGSQKLTQELAKAGIDKVFELKIGEFNSEKYAFALSEFIRAKTPKIVLFGATSQGRDIAPKVATSLKTGLTADCTGLELDENGNLMATRPTFGGELMATIKCKTLPQMASIRPRVFMPAQVPYKENCPLEGFEVNFGEEKSFSKIIDFIKKNNDNRLDLAQIIVAGGAGARNFEIIENFARKIGATVGASRAAVELGLAPHEAQIGQTGKVVTPKLYIACGISGAIQHLAGINGAKCIVAINKDPKAPIFKHCDIGMVGDVGEILAQIEKEL